MNEELSRKRAREEEMAQARKLGASETDIAAVVFEEQDEEKENKKRKEMIETLSKLREKLMAHGTKVKSAFQEAREELEKEEQRRAGKK